MVFDLNHCVSLLREEAKSYQHSSWRSLESCHPELQRLTLSEWVRVTHKVLTGPCVDNEIFEPDIYTAALRYTQRFTKDDLFSTIRRFTDVDQLSTLAELAARSGLLDIAHQSRESQTTSRALRRLTRAQYDSIMESAGGDWSHANFLKRLIDGPCSEPGDRCMKDLALLLAEDHVGTYHDLIALATTLTRVPAN